MAPSTLGPAVLMQDNMPISNEICSIRLPIGTSLGDTTNSATWTGMGGQSLGKSHFCIVFRGLESEDDSKITLELLVLRSFGVRGRETAEKSLHTHLLLPLPVGETPPPTPVGFGTPLKSPRFQPLKETWIVARGVVIEVAATSTVRKYLPRATFLDAELARIKQYMDKLRIKPSPSYVSQAHSPALPPTVSAKGTTARTWSQVVGEAAYKQAADKAATEQGSYRTRQLQRRKEGVRTKNFRGIWDLTQAQHPHRLSRSMISPHTLMPCSYIAQKSWLMSRGVTPTTIGLPHPPPPIPFLVEMEAEAKVRRSNEAVELWLGKI